MKKLTALVLCLAASSLLLAQGKEDERLANSATAMQQILGENNGLPLVNLLDQTSPARK